jgi:hypothetical protein
MKQYTNEIQTTKLIELGFAKPKSSVECELPKGDWRIGQVGIRKVYSIGELIEMLPRVVEDEDSEYATISIYHDTISWVIDYQSPERCFYAISNIELVDALYEMIVKLKEEGI